MIMVQYPTVTKFQQDLLKVEWIRLYIVQIILTELLNGI